MIAEIEQIIEVVLGTRCQGIDLIRDGHSVLSSGRATLELRSDRAAPGSLKHRPDAPNSRWSHRDRCCGKGRRLHVIGVSCSIEEFLDFVELVERHDDVRHSSPSSTIRIRFLRERGRSLLASLEAGKLFDSTRVEDHRQCEPLRPRLEPEGSRGRRRISGGLDEHERANLEANGSWIIRPPADDGSGPWRRQAHARLVEEDGDRGQVPLRGRGDRRREQGRQARRADRRLLVRGPGLDQARHPQAGRLRRRPAQLQRVHDLLDRRHQRRRLGRPDRHRLPRRRRPTGTRTPRASRATGPSTRSGTAPATRRRSTPTSSATASACWSWAGSPRARTTKARWPGSRPASDPDAALGDAPGQRAEQPRQGRSPAPSGSRTAWASAT